MLYIDEDQKSETIVYIVIQDSYQVTEIYYFDFKRKKHHHILKLAVYASVCMDNSIQFNSVEDKSLRNQSINVLL